MRLIDVNDADPRSMAFPIHADGDKYTHYERGYNDGVISCYGLLMNAPTVDAVPVVHGRWLDICEDMGLLKCNLCGSVNHERYHYCPNCGAKMDKEVNDDAQM